jgi:outer membrane protein assembly factor BamB
VTASEGGFPSNETPVAADPADPERILSGANDFGFCGAAFFASGDRGQSWARHCMEADFDGDPVVAYDALGAAYIGGIGFIGGGQGAIDIQRSTDNGLTWGPPVAAVSPTDPNGFADKPSLVIDTTPSSPHFGALYVSVTQFNSDFSTNQITVSHSYDGGATWSRPVPVGPVEDRFVLPRGTVDQGSQLAVAADGTVYATWLHCANFGREGCAGQSASVMMASSSDAGTTFTAPHAIQTVNLVPTVCGSDTGWGCLPNTNERLLANPVIAVDDSSGPTAGRLYLADYSWAGSYMRVQVSSSADRGEMWSAPVGVAAPGDTHDQFMPWMSVSQNGFVGVSWMDRGADSANVAYQAVAAVSSNGGASFETPRVISAHSSDPSNDGFGGFFLGDYTGNAWAGNRLVVSWPDTSSGIAQDEVGGIVVPGAGSNAPTDTSLTPPPTLPPPPPPVSPGPSSPQTSWPLQDFDAANTGYNPAETVLNPGNVSGLGVAWIRHVGSDLSSHLVVADGAVYIGVAGALVSLDANSGANRWSSPISGRFTSAPVVALGNVYAVTSDGILHTVDSATGATIWTANLGSPDVVEAPNVSQGVVYASAGPNVYAFDAASGASLWTTTLPNGTSQSVSVADGRVFVGTDPGGQAVYALDAATGAIVWVTAKFGNTISSDPVVADGKVFFTANFSTLIAVDESTGATLWTRSPCCSNSLAVASGVLYTGGGAFEAATGTMLWPSANSGADAVANGVVYDGQHAVSAATGALLWSSPIGSSAVVVNGSVYSPNTADGNVYMLRLNTSMTSAAGPDPWPMLAHGPDHSGYNAAENVISAANVASLTPQLNLVGYTATPSVANGFVYAGLTAFDESTLGFVWSAVVPPAEIVAPPTVAGGMVYVGSFDDRIYAFRADGCGRSSCQPVWAAATRGPIQAAPTVANGIVYAGSWDGSVVALDATTGALIWQQQTGLGVMSSPAVVNGVLYVGSNDHLVYAFNAATGEMLWTAPTGAAVRSSPVVTNGIVIVQPDDGTLYAIDATIGALRWSFARGIVGSVIDLGLPVAANGMVLVSSLDSNFTVSVTALSATTGGVIWTDAALFVDNGGSAGASGANGVLSLTGDGTGGQHLVALDVQSGAVLASFSTSPFCYYGISGPPIVADGRLFAPTGCGLRVFGVNS